MITTASPASGFDTQGHRGARGLAPENTFAAMKAGLDAGVKTLEMDVGITKDKQVVLSHDSWFNHLISTKPDGQPVTAAEEKSLKLYGMDYAEVRKYDVGMRPHPGFPKQARSAQFKPLLSDLLDDVAEYMKGSRRPLPFFNIETKCLPAGDNIYHPEPGVFVELLMGVIKDKQLEDRVIIQSFDFRTLRYLHQHYPAIQTAMLLEATDKRSIPELVKDLGFTPTIDSPEQTLVTAARIKAAHDAGIRIIPWTVNKKEEITRLKTLGVDGIITDYPDLF
ncbi:MAG: glycerophosphodiester phosphodiesterase [Chitinophagaceae bacterium]|nr:MAG: glycerophosphodiester phosphodiesterase [Chitinophagaceae bacterium]